MKIINWNRGWNKRKNEHKSHSQTITILQWITNQFGSGIISVWMCLKFNDKTVLKKFPVPILDFASTYECGTAYSFWCFFLLLFSFYISNGGHVIDYWKHRIWFIDWNQ